MTLTLYNTLTRRKEPFKPIDPTNVRMYVCGPTVYDLAHIGNARPIIVFDVLFRLLRHLAARGEWDGGKGETKVTYARNITDVDDKINARAVERYPELDPIEAIRKLTEETTAQFHKDIAALGVLMPEDVNKPGEPPQFIEPRATDYIRRADNHLDMVRLIETLHQHGCAYVEQDHVLFDVASMPDYGRLANRSLNEMEAGARVDVAPYKKGPMDFVLWKPSKPGEPAWQSPLGIVTPGRPGWHIECSAMAGAILGPTFDIHGGGIDLVFPHHENEIAQSRCAHGTDVMANFWMHNGFLQVEGEKMSKSLGNFVTIKELLEGNGRNALPIQGDAVRLAMMMTHYRQPLDWTRQRALEASVNLHTFHLVAIKGLGLSHHADDTALQRYFDLGPSSGLLRILCDDLNTPSVVLTHLFSLVRAADQKGGVKAEPAAQLLADSLFLGLNPFRHVRETEEAYGKAPPISREEREEIDARITARLAARKAKDWTESDRIRDELAAMGIQLKDVKDPATGEIKTEWEVKR